MRYEGNTIIPDEEDKKNYVGIELEFSSKLNENQWDELLCEFVDENKVIVGYDGSIDCTKCFDSNDWEDFCNCYGIEIKVIDTEINIFKTLKEVLKIINKNDAHINETCGLHIHIDMRNRSNPDKVYSNLIRSVPFLQRKVTKNRINNTYCKSQTSTILGLANTSKYHDINVSNYYSESSPKTTFEIRMHHGTLNFNEISNWIRIILKIVNFNKSIKPVKTVDSFTKQLKASILLKKYLKSKKVVI